MKKKIFIITLSDLRYDARVRRQVDALKDHYNITLAGFSAVSTKDFELITITPTNLTFLRKLVTSVFLTIRNFPLAHRILHAYAPILREKLDGKKFDLVIANDVETLPLAFDLPGNHPVIFDAHEYAPRHFEDKFMWRIFFQPFNVWLCRKYLPRVAAMMTVGQGLAREYKKNFNVDAVVIPNANNYFDLTPTAVEDNQIRLVHVGIANPSRKLELMIDMMRALDSRFSLHMYLLTPGFASSKTKNYIDELKTKIGADHRIRIFPPVESLKVVTTLNQYDIGVFLLPPINFNYENTLPNKLFDFIQARLGVAIGPTPEMAEIVNRYQNGVVAKDFTAASLAAELSKLTRSQVEMFKKNSALAAVDINAEKNSVVIRQIVDSVISKKHP
jgi:glycosyltransferase involved in cell wall biosynthesis